MNTTLTRFGAAFCALAMTEISERQRQQQRAFGREVYRNKWGLHLLETPEEQAGFAAEMVGEPEAGVAKPEDYHTAIDARAAVEVPVLA